jgi:hypothetical protein
MMRHPNLTMSTSATSTAPASITVRAPAAEKARFSTLAHAAGMSESRLALIAIREFLDAKIGAQAPSESDPTGEQVRASDRITIRLRPGDGAAIVRRALERGVKPATYLAAMARAHVAASPPLLAEELATLKHSLAILCGLGTLLARSAHYTALSGPEFEDVRLNLSRIRTAVAALEERTHNFIKAALIAWESRVG